jgi:hypothetical protein
MSLPSSFGFQECIFGKLKFFPNIPFIKFILKGPNTADTYIATFCFALIKPRRHQGKIALDQNMNISVL